MILAAPGKQTGVDAFTPEAGQSFAAADGRSLPWLAVQLAQARFTGTYVAHCMAGVEQDFGSSFGLELFTHATRFFGLKVCLLRIESARTVPWSARVAQMSTRAVPLSTGAVIPRAGDWLAGPSRAAACVALLCLCCSALLVCCLPKRV